MPNLLALKIDKIPFILLQFNWLMVDKKARVQIDSLAERLACRGVADAAMEAWKIKADVGETALAALASESRRADAALCETLLVLGGDAGGAMQAATA